MRRKNVSIAQLTTQKERQEVTLTLPLSVRILHKRSKPNFLEDLEGSVELLERPIDSFLADDFPNVLESTLGKLRTNTGVGFLKASRRRAMTDGKKTHRSLLVVVAAEGLVCGLLQKQSGAGRT